MIEMVNLTQNAVFTSPADIPTMTASTNKARVSVIMVLPRPHLQPGSLQLQVYLLKDKGMRGKHTSQKNRGEYRELQNIITPQNPQDHGDQKSVQSKNNAFFTVFLKIGQINLKAG